LSNLEQFQLNKTWFLGWRDAGGPERFGQINQLALNPSCASDYFVFGGCPVLHFAVLPTFFTS